MTTRIAGAIMALGLALLLAGFDACGADFLSSPVPDRVQTNLQTLFQKYYPKADFTNHNVFEYEVTTFEFPYTGPPGRKHEATTQRGPKKGGVLCHIYGYKGNYQGQLALFPRGNGQFSPHLIDRKHYKQLVMAPYSPKRDVHLWVSLSYPPGVSEEFLKEFRAIMADFEKDA